MGQRGMKGSGSRLAGGLVAFAALGLGACGPEAPKPVVDRFQPARPTRPGGLGDAVRHAASGSLETTEAEKGMARGEVGQRAGDRARRATARGVELQAAQVLPPEAVVVRPEALTDAQRAGVEAYLSLLARLNVELGSASGEGERIASRVGPVVDELRSTLDGLLGLTAGQRLTVEREFGVRQRGLEEELATRLAALRRREGMSAVVNLVADVPTLE